MRKLLVFFVGNFAVSGSVGLNRSEDSKSNLRYLPSNTRRALFRRTAKKIFATIALCTIVGSAAHGQVEIINNGNVGIGINIPTQKLHVVGNSFFNGNVGIGINIPTHKFHVVGNSFFNGNVGIGTTNPTYKLDVTGESRFNAGNGLWDEIIIGSYAYTTPPNPYEVSFTWYCPAIYSSQNELYLGIPDSWVWQTYSSNITCNYLYNLSDMRFKENIRLCSPVLSKLKNVQSYNYNLKNDFSGLDSIQNGLASKQKQKAQKTEYGFLAQELQTIFPELVNAEDSSKLSVNYIGMIPILTAAINELQTKMDGKIEELTLYIRELERRIAELEAKKGGE